MDKLSSCSLYGVPYLISDRPSSCRAMERKDRMTLRPWLIDQINSGKHPGLRWINKEQGLFRIPWMHKSKKEWKVEHIGIFLEWAKHTDKYKEGDDQPDFVTMKSRLRCALAKTPSIVEVTGVLKIEDNMPYKVYQILPIQENTKPSPPQVHKLQPLGLSKMASTMSSPADNAAPILSVTDTITINDDSMSSEFEAFHKASLDTIPFSEPCKLMSNREVEIDALDLTSKSSQSSLMNDEEGSYQPFQNDRSTSHCDNATNSEINYTNQQDTANQECELAMSGFQTRLSEFMDQLNKRFDIKLALDTFSEILEFREGWLDTKEKEIKEKEIVLEAKERELKDLMGQVEKTNAITLEQEQKLREREEKLQQKEKLFIAKENRLKQTIDNIQMAIANARQGNMQKTNSFITNEGCVSEPTEKEYNVGHCSSPIALVPYNQYIKPGIYKESTVSIKEDSTTKPTSLYRTFSPPASNSRYSPYNYMFSPNIPRESQTETAGQSFRRYKSP